MTAYDRIVAASSGCVLNDDILRNGVPAENVLDVARKATARWRIVNGCGNQADGGRCMAPIYDLVDATRIVDADPGGPGGI